MKERNWSYLAGLFDGEGCISMESWNRTDSSGYRYIQHGLVIAIINTDKRLMDWLIKYFGGVYYTEKFKNGKWATKYMWRPKGAKNKEAFLLGILPYACVKREQILNALEYIRLPKVGTKEQRAILVERSRTLKALGKSVETNTQVPEEGMIESDLTGDCESAPLVTVDA